MIPKFKFARSSMARDGGTEEVKEIAFAPPKIKKRRLSMDPVVDSSRKSTDYSAPTEESISLVGKSIGMSSATSRGFTPQTVGVGQMKLEAPPQYSGRRQPRVRIWLSQMECYMRFMRHTPTN